MKIIPKQLIVFLILITIESVLQLSEAKLLRESDGSQSSSASFTSEGTRNCISQESCGSCLQADFVCSWCVDMKYDMKKPRCLTKSGLMENNCRPEMIISNQEYPPEIIVNDDLHDYHENSKDAVQIKPQKVKIKLVKGRNETVQFRYRIAKNYPLDLYYLMDLTWSMADDKETLASMGSAIAIELQELTQMFSIGFGSFADKPAMPFIYTGDEARKNPCKSQNAVCEPTYTFKHSAKLSKNITAFIEEVKETEITANVDNLEGGMDALMQILVCGDKIGWRNKSRKIIVFASDGLTHYAGDGILAGIVMKNDKTCHLDDEGNYYAALDYDYPSIEELYHELIKYKANIIFATTGENVNVYNQLHALMPDITSVGTLSIDSSNVLQLIKDGYKKFVNQVRFINDAPDFIKVSIETTCSPTRKRLIRSSQCDNMKIGDEYEFNVTFDLKDIPDDVNSTYLINIIERGTSEVLQVAVEIQPECSCDKEVIFDENSLLCNLNGNFSCGICDCNDGWSGTACDCNLLDFDSNEELNKQCRVPFNYSEMADPHVDTICSNRGDCECGVCHCPFGLSGKYCECDGCPRYNFKECGDNAYCDCGQCVCLTGWSGDKCDCPTSKDTCIPLVYDTVTICSGYGSCVCGKCSCDAGRSGIYCEIDKDIDTLCINYDNCVKCLVARENEKLREGKSTDNITDVTCSDLEYHRACTIKNGTYLSDNLHFSFYHQLENPKCVIRTIENGINCNRKYSYQLDSEYYKLHIESPECDQTLIRAGMIGIVVAFLIILCGVGILIFFKSYDHIRYKKELAKFRLEQSNETYQLSPLYKSPITVHRVPSYNSESNAVFD